MRRVLYSILTVSLLSGCIDVVNVDLESDATRLVVDGRIEAIKGSGSGYQEIRLSTTGDFYDSAQTPRVTDAIVAVTDESGMRFSFDASSTEPGLYTTDELVAEVGRTYALSIGYQGDTYASTALLAAVPEIDSVYIATVEGNLFDEAGRRLRIDFTDPAGVENYYFWEQFRNGELILEPNPGTQFTIISSDEFYDGGRVIGNSPNDEIDYVTGDTATIRQIGLTKDAYEYLRLLYIQVGGEFLFQPPPATLRGNIRNVTNPEQYPLGYFSAGEVDERMIVVGEE